MNIIEDLYAQLEKERQIRKDLEARLEYAEKSKENLISAYQNTTDVLYDVRKKQRMAAASVLWELVERLEDLDRKRLLSSGSAGITGIVIGVKQLAKRIQTKDFELDQCIEKHFGDSNNETRSWKLASGSSRECRMRRVLPCHGAL